MRGKIFFLLGSIFFLFLLPIPKYVELNQLVLVHSAEVYCHQQQYEVIITEIFPKKEDNGVQYHFKQYEKTGSDLNEIKKSLESDEKKKFYYKGLKKISTNCLNSQEIMDTFKVSSQKIKTVPYS